MGSADFDTLAAAGELRAAGIESAHAEAIVNTVSQATSGLLTESRFETVIGELRTEFRVELREHRAYLDQRLAEHTVALSELRSATEAGLAKQAAALETGLAKQAAALEAGLARQTAALAEFKGEIYRYLWIQGGSIIVILSSLYMLAESWSRG